MLAQAAAIGYERAMRRILTQLCLLLALVAVSAAGLASTAADLAGPLHVKARLVADRLTAKPGETVTIAIEQVIEPGWHTYWSNPGDAGLPTTAKWLLAPGWQAGPIQWPYPKREQTGPLMDYGYEHNVWLLVDLKVPQDAKPGMYDVTADVDWLVCREVCVPENARVSQTVFVDANGSVPDAVTAEKFAAVRAQLPTTSPWPVHYAKTDKGLQLVVTAPGLSGASRPVSAVFFPAKSGLITGIAPQELRFSKDGLVLDLTPSPRFHGGSLDGVLVLTSKDGSVQALHVAAVSGAPVSGAGDLGIWAAMLFAFLGGLILNIMPCVLPVLAMKVLAMARAGTSRGHARAESLAYGLGAIASFVALGLLLAGLREAGAMIGWGFQLQQPIVVAGLALLFLAVGLNLSSVYEINPVTAGDSLTRKSGLTGAFFTGVLAVAVAAPCTAPFMASAVGFGATQGVGTAFGVFAALGIGFAFPFLLIAAFPGTCKYLPKPGNWMVTLKHWLAVPIYATVIWLIWVLAKQVPLAGLIIVIVALVLAGVTLWLWGRGYGKAALAALVLTVATAVAAGFMGVGLASSNASVVNAQAFNGLGEVYSARKLETYRKANRPVFVDASASWCITCLVNEEAVLKKPEVAAAFKKQNVAILVADWTNRDPEVTKLLEANGRSGVPLYAYYPAGGGAPKLLPQILTVDAVLKVLTP